ncbi:hypothetical protein IWQ55_006520 [Labrenzia sp. EL_208]|nr:hypothetical protein [Labrenzia sp. EL_132]MBG6233280.1 hypothetical protein [Labrenzia sp. EL_208]
MADIEKIYRTHIHYEGDADAVDEVEAKAFALSSQLEVESFVGCPACSPYITAEGEEEAEVSIWADNLEQFITRLNGATLQP